MSEAGGRGGEFFRNFIKMCFYQEQYQKLLPFKYWFFFRSRKNGGNYRIIRLPIDAHRLKTIRSYVRSFNPISTRGKDYAHHIISWSLDFQTFIETCSQVQFVYCYFNSRTYYHSSMYVHSLVFPHFVLKHKTWDKIENFCRWGIYLSSGVLLVLVSQLFLIDWLSKLEFLSVDR